MKSVNKTAQMPEIGKEYRFEKNVVIRFWDRSKIIRKPIIILWWCSLPMGKTAFIYGRCGRKAEEDMIKENYDLECDVLKVGHHGSYTATGG